MRFACNIDKTDRINRTIIGSALCIAALIGMGKYFYVALGLALIIEGIVGWCSIPYLLSKEKVKQIFASKYQLYLPTEEQLENEIRREVLIIKQKRTEQC